MNKPLVYVVAAVILRDNRWFVGRRPRQKQYGGLWELPGGKVEEGESDFEALRRELREELDVELVATMGVLFEAVDHPWLVRLIPARIRGEPQASEHSEIKWASYEEMKEMYFTPVCQAWVDMNWKGA